MLTSLTIGGEASEYVSLLNSIRGRVSQELPDIVRGGEL